MKEILFYVGSCFAVGSMLGLIIKTLSKAIDPNERLSDKMPPYWLYAVTSVIACIALSISHFCF